MRNRVGIQEVSQRLADNIENLCAHLLPSGAKHGQVYEVGSIHGEPGKTLKVNLGGQYRGHWQDWNGQEHKGDALDLWAQARAIPIPEALRQAKEWLGIHEPVLPDRTYAKPVNDRPELTMDGRAMTWLMQKRGLKPSIVNLYRVQGDAKAEAIVFPCYSPTGDLVNRSWRTLTTPKKVWQDKEAAPCLFGWQTLTPAIYAKREILICEGQIDAMTWAQWGVAALSIPNGSGKTWLEYEWPNLEAFKTIYLSFDDDGAGRKNLDEVCSRLGKHRCRIVRMPHKDANAALVAGVAEAEARGWVEAAEYATVAHLVNAAHYTEQTIEAFFPSEEKQGHAVPQTVHSDPALTFRFRPAELTLWTGVSSHGKSTLLNYLLLMLSVKTTRPVLIVSFEMQPAKVLRRLMLACGMVIANPKDVRDALRDMKHRLLFCDKEGSIEKAELFELLNYAYARYGISHVGIDSLMRIRGLEENYPAQNEFVTDLATFAHETGVHVHLVAHPRKSPGHNSPEAHDIKGSGHIRDNADNILVVWRNREKEKMIEEKKPGTDKMPDAILKVEKDREEGTYREFRLAFNRFNYHYTPWTAPVEELREHPNSRRR